MRTAPTNLSPTPPPATPVAAPTSGRKTGDAASASTSAAPGKFGKALSHARDASKPAPVAAKGADASTRQTSAGKMSKSGGNGKAAASAQAQIPVKLDKALASKTSPARQEEEDDALDGQADEQTEKDPQAAQLAKARAETSADETMEVDDTAEATAQPATLEAAASESALPPPAPQTQTSGAKRAAKAAPSSEAGVNVGWVNSKNSIANTGDAEATEGAQETDEDQTTSTSSVNPKGAASTATPIAVGRWAKGSNAAAGTAAPGQEAPAAPTTAANAQNSAVAAAAPPVAATDTDAGDASGQPKTIAQPADVLATLLATPDGPAAAPAAAKSVPAPAPTPELRFASENNPPIITAVQGHLLPGGGTMQIRLDPPDLGMLQISVEMRDGVMNATFQTSNEAATHLLSHSLSQLKGALEAQGVSVEKLQVQQAPRDSQARGEEQSSQQQGQGESETQQEQQRRQMMQRLWRRLAVGKEPLDLVA